MKNQPYPEEFRLEAARQITERGHKVAEVSARVRRAFSLALAAIGASAGAAQFEVLHSFDGTDGQYPWGAPVLDAQGNLYGTTIHGGKTALGGVLWRIAGGEFTVLHEFGKQAKDGGWPYGSLTLNGDGEIVGTTYTGGAFGLGTLFKWNPATGYSVLWSFDGGADGGGPVTGVVQDADGFYYGTTSNGGDAPCQCGTVFRFDAAARKLVTLHTFEGSGNPQAALLLAGHTLWGTTSPHGHAHDGAPFSLGDTGHPFDGVATTGGDRFSGGLVQDATGVFYGTTWASGPNDDGIVYRLVP